MSELFPQQKKAVLIGNLAIVRGALESGVGFASTYPGTPASEIGDGFASIARKEGIYFEYSINEKVAAEAAAGAAFCGVRSIVSMKHFGFNVASDSILPVVYHGVKAGMLIVVADDPNCWSSGQSEQDSRYYARMGHIPMIEPTNASECKEFVKIAFNLSEKYKIPFMIRLTTRVSHSSDIVSLGKIKKRKTTGKFTNEDKWNNMPPKIMQVHLDIHKKLDEIREWNEKSKLNSIIKGRGRFGIITTGVSFNYVMDSLKKLKLKVPILKIGFTYPLPEKLISKFIKSLKSVLVLEELEPIVEDEIKRIAKDANPKLKVNGKNILPIAGEFRMETVSNAICKVLGRKFYLKPREIEVPARPPILCPGCPHRASFWSTKHAAGNVIYGGDVGCYILGLYKPLEAQDFIISMGANEGIVHGISKVSKQKSISFVGDSTFFHAGIPGLINMVYNKSDHLFIVLDNKITAMTGHQPTPATGETGMCEKTKKISIQEMLKACGVDEVVTVNVYNVKEMQNAVRTMLKKKGVNAIVASGECRLMFMRRAKEKGIKVPVFQIDQKKCTKCGICLYTYGCPAIHRVGLKGEFYIDEDFCWGCGVCAQICPPKAIFPKVKK
jgi:indolepyruvate ferredoxin oxidoreductase alpha subunit